MPHGLDHSDNTNRLFDQGADPVGLDEDLRRLLKTHFGEARVEMPVRMWSGLIEVLPGYRVQHSGARGHPGLRPGGEHLERRSACFLEDVNARLERTMGPT